MTRKKPTAKVAACKEHSCKNPRGASGYCGEHQIKGRRHHDKKQPLQSKEE